MTFTYRGQAVPDSTLQGLLNWINHGVTPGQFLCAVLRNDLRDATFLADESALKSLPATMAWLHNEAPAAAWGSVEKVHAWGDRCRAREITKVVA